MHRILAVVTLVFATSTMAHAGLVFDTITGNSPAGYSGPQSDGSTIMAASFTDAGTPNFSTISFLLAADNPTDRGSVQVFLAPDDGSGKARGLAGNPDNTHAVQVASISDSSLANLSSGAKLVTISNIPNSVGRITDNNEYWVELQPQPLPQPQPQPQPQLSSVEWAYNASGKGFNTANQASFTNESGVYPDNNSSGTNTGAFALQVVDAPEPATIGLLGAGLACLGAFRRRNPARVRAHCRSMGRLKTQNPGSLVFIHGLATFMQNLKGRTRSARPLMSEGKPCH